MLVSAPPAPFHGRGLRLIAMACCSGTAGLLPSRANLAIAARQLDMAPMDILMPWLFHSSFCMTRTAGIASCMFDMRNRLRGPQALPGRESPSGSVTAPQPTHNTDVDSSV